MVTSSSNNYRRIAVLLFLILCWPITAVAESAVSCHCFRDRTYNPAARFAADDYILATTFNSLIARNFAIPKQEVVMLKMRGGVEQADLLVALQIATTTGADLQDLLAGRKDNQPWQTIIATPASAQTDKKEPVLDSLRAGNSTEQTSQLVADTMLVNLFEIPLIRISELRDAGLDEKEITLLLILAKTTRQPLQKIADLHTKEGRSWSEIAHNFGIEAAATGKLVLEYNRDAS